MTASVPVPLLLALAAVGIGALFAIIGITVIAGRSRRRRGRTRLTGEAHDDVWDGNDRNRRTQFWKLGWTAPGSTGQHCRNPFGVSGGALRSFPFPVELVIGAISALRLAAFG